MEYGIRPSDLPETVVIERERVATADSIRSDNKELQNAFKRLSGHPDLAPLPPLENINKEWLKAIIEKKTNEVDELPGITENERIERKSVWHGIKHAAMINVSILERIKAKYGDAIRFDEEINLPWISNADSIAEKMCARPVPDEAKEHHQLLIAVAQTTSELRFWEFCHNVKRIPLNIILRWNNNTLAEAWATGEIYDVKPETLPTYLRSKVEARQEEERRTIL